MNNPKHTPGPWLARKHSIQANSGRMIATLSIGNETCKANARLIAAAPELLEASQNLIKWLGIFMGPQGIDELNGTYPNTIKLKQLNDLVTAITKATGGAE